jgi:serine/threonine protein kinase
MVNSYHVDQHIAQYRLSRLLGQGESSEVYLAEHAKQNEPVAIKISHGRHVGDELAKFFARTSRIAQMRHPHIVSVRDYGAEGDFTYIVMDYVPNGSLRERHPKKSIVHPAKVLDYVQQVASGLEYIHKHGLVHRDIKPHNMLVDIDNTIKISDFGTTIISPSLQSLHPEQYDFEGTVIYAAPEQLQGKPQASSDLYALAVVIYEWLCGDWPFSGDFQEIAHQHLHVSPPALCSKNADLSPTIEQVVMKALAKDTEKRFDSVEVFAEALKWAIQATSPEIPTPSRRQFMPPLPFQPAKEQ